MLDKLTENIKEIRFGSHNRYDYKSGYYDANKKELYIKDEENIPAIYLRLLYALTAKEIDENVYRIGYSTTKLRKDSYKLSYTNFGINRAIMANLVFKLCNMLPLSLQLTPTKKTYTHDFLGFKIEATNDIYSLEGKLLAELCYVLDIDPEHLYSELFTKNPAKYLNSVFDKKKFENKNEFLTLFDNISRNYNTYNKLAFLSNKLNENYLDYKKHVLNDNVDSIKKEQEIIESTIMSTISYLYEDKFEEENEDFEVTAGLAEALEDLETKIKADLIAFQNILADNLIKTAANLPSTKYASKLKCFNDILIVPNPKILKTLQDTILFKLMPDDEVTGINLVQKIKYALIEKILSDKDYANISNTFSFYNITSLEDTDKGSTIILLNSNKGVARVMEVKGLNLNIKNSNKFKLKYIPLDNLQHIMTTNYTSNFVGNVERLYTTLRNNFEEFKSTPLENMFTFEYEKKQYLVVYAEKEVAVVSYTYSNLGYGFTKLNLSEQYKVFGKTVPTSKNFFKSNLPILKNK